MALAYMGRGSGLGLGKELSGNPYGTAVARSCWQELVSCNLQRTFTRQFRPNLSATNAIQSEIFLSDEAAAGDAEFEAVYNSPAFGNVLFAALGAGATTGSGPYTHAITTGTAATVPAFTLEFLRGTGTAEVFEGMKCSSLTLSQSAGDIMRVRTSWIGQTSGGRTSGGTPSYTASAAPILHSQAGSLSWNSLTFAKISSFDVTIDNSLERRQYLGSAQTTEPDFSGFRSITCNLGLHWDVDSFHSGLIAGTSSTASLLFTGSGNNRFTTTLYNAVVFECADPITTAGVVTQNVTLRARDGSGNNGIGFQLINDVAGGSYVW